ncbi:MAG: hypothetical protein RBS37_03725 [Bacteroidales bacterium]|jgi:hypothetical protein|nr:hypothetical protein [Bacteroidales bacterium]
MIRIKILFILAIISIIDGPPSVQGQIQPVPPRVIFNSYIKNYKLKYTLPRGFAEADTITESYILPFVKKPTPFNRTHVNVYNKSFSNDSNVMIIWELAHVSKQTEINARKIFPDADNSRHHIYLIRGLVGANQCIRGDSLIFDEDDILFYDKNVLKRLGAEVAGEYTIRLTDPYFDYTHLTLRFVVIPYTLNIYTYIFYKVYSEELKKEISKKTRYMMKFR